MSSSALKIMYGIVNDPSCLLICFSNLKQTATFESIELMGKMVALFGVLGREAHTMYQSIKVQIDLLVKWK
jgi:hypothetical protein